MAQSTYDVLGGPHESTNEEQLATAPVQQILDTAQASADLAGDYANKVGSPVDADGNLSAKAHALDAASKAAAAQSAANTALAAVGQVQDAVNTNLPVLDAKIAQASDAADDATTIAEAVAGNVDLTTEAAALAARWAAAQPGEEIEAGKQSARSYAEQALGLIGATPSQPLTILRDPSGASAAWERIFVAADLYRKFVVRGTAFAATLRLPVNLFTDAWPPDGGPAAAWIRVKREAGTAAVAIAGLAGGGTVNPSQIVNQTFPERLTVGPAAETSRTRRVTVPYGVNRRIVVLDFSLYENADASRNTRCTATVVGGAAITMTKIAGDLATAGWGATGANLDGAAFVGVVPDNAAGDTSSKSIDVTMTWSTGVFLMVTDIAVAKDTGGHIVINPVADTAETDSFVDLSGNAASAPAIAFLGAAQKNGDGDPVTLSPGVSDYSGVAPKNADGTTPPGQRTITYLFGHHSLATSGAKSWRAQFSATRRGAGLGVILTPAAAVSGVTIDAAGGVLAIPVGGEALIEPLSDGSTYHVTVQG